MNFSPMPSRVISAIVLTLAAAAGAGCAAPEKARHKSGPQVFEQDGKTAYMSREVTLKEAALRDRWALIATIYQNDLTHLGRPDADAPVLLLFAFAGDTDQDSFSTPREHLHLAMNLDEQPVLLPIQWQGGPDTVLTSTTLRFAAVLSPETVRKMLAADLAVAGIVDTATPVNGKAWTQLYAFDLKNTGVIDQLRAFYTPPG